jgi:hypothetical protein
LLIVGLDELKRRSGIKLRPWKIGIINHIFEERSCMVIADDHSNLRHWGVGRAGLVER